MTVESCKNYDAQAEGDFDGASAWWEVMDQQQGAVEGVVVAVTVEGVVALLVEVFLSSRLFLNP